MYEGKRVINGTYGEVWLDSDKVAECIAFQAKLDFKKEPVQICGKPGEHHKLTGWTGKGNMRINKVTSRMAIRLREQVKNLKEQQFTVISKLADPDAYGPERVALYYVSFDDLTIADWEADKLGQVDHPFTFSDLEYLDEIDPSLM